MVSASFVTKQFAIILSWLAVFAASIALTEPAIAGIVRLPVPNTTLYPGDLLSENVLSSRRFKSSATSRAPVALNPEQVIGKVATRTLLRGKPIALHALREPYLVKKGSQIRVIYAVGGLIITTYAMSLKSGELGAVIQARNLDSGKIITGTIDADGSMIVRMP